ncbi:MAG: hypothetical protein KDK66_02090 [Deltaproteobacteria bacterium]|nr:hypothetical protein [Deltaproteobacteria bacterium]
MQQASQDKVISIIGGDYFYPISILLETLFSFEEPNDVQETSVQTNHIQNGYSSAICLLLVAALESFLARFAYIKTSTQGETQKDFRENFKEKHPEFIYKKELDEIYVLRDCLIHNHLLTLDYNRLTMEKLKAEKDKRSGDKKYDQCVDSVTHKTKILELNVNPIRVDRHDVKKVIKIVKETLLFLEDKYKPQIQISDLMLRLSDSQDKKLLDILDHYSS